jgi:quercetin dioxygenase-like cupin family protein
VHERVTAQIADCGQVTFDSVAVFVMVDAEQPVPGTVRRAQTLVVDSHDSLSGSVPHRHHRSRRDPQVPPVTVAGLRVSDLRSSVALSSNDRFLVDRIVAFVFDHTAPMGPDAGGHVVSLAILAALPSLGDLSITLVSDRCSTRVQRQREDLELTTEPDKPFGYVEVIDEHERSGLYLLHIAPAHELGWHRHDVMRERELIVTDGLRAGTVRHGRVHERVTVAGTVVSLGRGVAHRYTNPTDSWQRVLCIDSPPFIPTDEIALADPITTGAAEQPDRP